MVRFGVGPFDLLEENEMKKQEEREKAREMERILNECEYLVGVDSKCSVCVGKDEFVV